MNTLQTAYAESTSMAESYEGLGFGSWKQIPVLLASQIPILHVTGWVRVVQGMKYPSAPSQNSYFVFIHRQYATLTKSDWNSSLYSWIRVHVLSLLVNSNCPYVPFTQRYLSKINWRGKSKGNKDIKKVFRYASKIYNNTPHTRYWKLIQCMGIWMVAHR